MTAKARQSATAGILMPASLKRRRWPKITWKEFQTLRHAAGRYCGLIEETPGHSFFQDVWVDHGFVYDFQKKRLIQFHLETRAVNQKGEFGVKNVNDVDRCEIEVVIFGSGEELNYRFYVTPSKFWSFGTQLDYKELHATADQAHFRTLLKLGKLPVEEIALWLKCQRNTPRYIQN